MSPISGAKAKSVTLNLLPFAHGPVSDGNLWAHRQDSLAKRTGVQSAPQPGGLYVVQYILKGTEPGCGRPDSLPLPGSVPHQTLLSLSFLIFKMGMWG